MMKEKNFSLLLASVLSVFSFVCLMVALKLPQNTSKNVLGATSSNLIPCSVINNWQTQYCSNITPSIVPTTPPPTPSSCTPNGACLPQGGRCCNGSPFTVRTTICPSGLVCQEIKNTPIPSVNPQLTPTNPPRPTACTPPGYCLSPGTGCCGGYPLTVNTNICPSGKKCVPMPTPAPTH